MFAELGKQSASMHLSEEEKDAYRQMAKKRKVSSTSGSGEIEDHVRRKWQEVKSIMSIVKMVNCVIIL